ncbi:MAG: DUF1566 domain-containing protein [Planctomycetes bacterium]|nr:DUF1566 domain-containing protein [Planctomycetota bacterium]
MKKQLFTIFWRFGLLNLSIALFMAIPNQGFTQSYPLIDTGQENCYNDVSQIAFPDAGAPFYGQDAQYEGIQPVYQDNEDGTITDSITGLMWQKTPGQKVIYDEAVANASSFNLAGHTDWRLPTIKELYSLIMFSGIDPSGWQGNDPSDLIPFIDTDYFDFEYGNPNAGERIIDAQYWSSTEYVSTTMNGDATAFGVNFADGRIKGYPAEPIGPPGNQFTMTGFVRYVRGNPDYGVNGLVDNGDGTVTDLATGLMWQKTDDGVARNWEEALAYAENLTSADYSDWRLPNAKELQSIVDYTRSPATTNSAAIDPVFDISSISDEGGETNYPFFWTNTTHANWTNQPGTMAVYIAFGEALGFMEMPPNSGNYQLLDVHGAGAQRSDSKSGDPADWPFGHGPQGDVVRIYNYVRCVREVTDPVGLDQEQSIHGSVLTVLEQNYPNPFHSSATISFSLPAAGPVSLKFYNVSGQLIDTLVNRELTAGDHTYLWSAANLPGGVYYCQLSSPSAKRTIKMTLLK